MALQIIILAAGQGTRMRSDKPKVLHKIGGKPLLAHVYELSQKFDNCKITVVYGFGGEKVLSELSDLKVTWIEQTERLGTGHAVMQATPALDDEDTVLVLYGDVPLLAHTTADRLLKSVDQNNLSLLTVDLIDPSGYGRIIRNQDNQVQMIVEEKDTTDQQKKIKEGNTGILATNAGNLKRWLSRLNNNNAQGEFYLTDIIAMAVSEGIPIKTSQPETVDEVLGINNKIQLAHLERTYQMRNAYKLMELGVTFADPHRFDLRGSILEVGQDVEFDVNVVLEGDIRIGNRVKIGPNTTIRDVEISDDVEILPNCLIEGAHIGKRCRLGPFARIRPEVKLSDDVRIGNFVEIKKSELGNRSKINHLSYIGDSEVGADVNIGAGAITCNYDGANKFKTIIEDGAFIGSDTQLVAPVTVSKNSTVGAGSTITKDTPADTLTLSRSNQISIKGWQRPIKKRN